MDLSEVRSGVVVGCLGHRFGKKGMEFPLSKNMRLKWKNAENRGVTFKIVNLLAGIVAIVGLQNIGGWNAWT